MFASQQSFATAEARARRPTMLSVRAMTNMATQGSPVSAARIRLRC